MKSLLVFILGVTLGAVGMKYSGEITRFAKGGVSTPRLPESTVTSTKTQSIGTVSFVGEGFSLQTLEVFSVSTIHDGEPLPRRGVLVSINGLGIDNESFELRELPSIRAALDRMATEPSKGEVRTWCLRRMELLREQGRDLRILIGHAVIELTPEQTARFDGLLAKAQS